MATLAPIDSRQERTARQLRNMGWSTAAIAQHLGVTELPVALVFDPDRASMIRATARMHHRAQRGTCPDCGRVTSGRGKRCYEHAGYRRATTVTPDLLRCARCHQWKPDEEFSADGKNRARRYHSIYCRDCEKARKLALASR